MATYTLAPVVNFTQFFNNLGHPLSGGKIFIYVANSFSVKSPTWGDINGDVVNPNPIVLDSSGRSPVAVWLDQSKEYQFILTLPDGTTVLKVLNNVSGTAGSINNQTPLWVNVKSTGAVGDGIVDDTDSILDAMAEASLLRTQIYLPAGEYKISAPLTNENAPDCMGIIGDSLHTSTIRGEALVDHGVVFTNPPQGLVLQDFGIIGPGQTSGYTSNGISLPIDGNGVVNISYLVRITNVLAKQFPSVGFYFQVPIVSTYTNCIAENIGDIGFYIDTFANPFVGGTSTIFNACYANDCTNKGFYFKSHVYSTMNACAADFCPISYHMFQCSGMTISGCGNESADAHTDIPAVGVLLDECLGGIELNNHWSYNFHNVDSVSLKLHNSTNNTINNLIALKEDLETTYDVIISTASNENTFVNCMNLNRPNGRIAIDDQTNGNGINHMSWGGHYGVTDFSIPDEFNNSLYTHGSVSITGKGGAGNGFINMYSETQPSFPRTTITSLGAIGFGTGDTDIDTILARTNINELGYNGTWLDSITIKGDSNPLLQIKNAGAAQDWVIGADNGGGLSFYDQTHSETTAYLWPVNGVAGQNGSLQLNNGISIRGGKIIADEHANGPVGTAFFPAAGSVVVANTSITANSRILLTLQNVFSGTAGNLWISNLNPGVGFTISSTNATQDASVYYMIVEP